jgi:hypothetical protein
MALPLEVLADLEIAVDGENIDVQADGDRIVVDLSTLEAGRRLVAGFPFSRNWSSKASADRLQDALQIAGLTVDIQLQGDLIARMGEGARPGRLARALNLKGLELRPAQSLRAVVRRRPFVTTLVVGGLFVLIGWLVARLLRSNG